LYQSRKLFEEAKKSLDPHESLEVFHAYFMHSSGFILNLFIAIEAFSNHLIPEEYKYVKPTRTCTEMYNKEEILRNISFDEKIKKVIPEIKNQSFHEKHGHLFDHLLKLKEFRDEIMHTKPSNGKSFKYQGLFVRALDFNYHSTIYAARDFINFYEPNLIEECGCGQDF
jgi:hypothetical protein